MSKIKLLFIFIIIILISLAFYFYKINYESRGFINSLINKAEGKTLNSKFQTKIKSGNLSTDYDIDQVLIDINKFGLNTLNIPVKINISDIKSNNMKIDTESQKKAIKLIKRLRNKKINIILEPYPWIENGVIAETQWKPSNINDFFFNWKNYVLKILIDKIAVPYHVDAFYIGSNFENMEAEEKQMCDMADYVRRYYKGLVTYRTNRWDTAVWEPGLALKYDRKLNNKVFSKLDFISIAAYFRLTENDTNTVEQLVASIHSSQIYNRKQNIKKEIQKFYDKWNKPVFFGELGFPKTNKASDEPYNPIVSDIKNNKEQANCFEAYRIVFENEPWNLGFSIFAVGENSSDKMYYPSEESTLILKKWYSSNK